MYDTGNVTQNRQEDIDEKVGIATSFEKDTERREDDSKDDLANVAVIHKSSAIIFRID